MLLEPLALFAAAMSFTQTDLPDTTSTERLDAVTVSARIASRKESPLRLNDITREDILRNAPGMTFVELIRGIPGIYSSAETGSFGDAKINIRGFKQENISVLLNGIPISGLTSGNMYWNNWMGLSSGTGSIQIQKGIGNSMLSDNSVGGTINIITLQPSDESSLSALYYHTGHGANGLNVSSCSGRLPHGWNLGLALSYTFGKTFVECSEVRAFSYLAVVTKEFNSRHSLNFTALGSPEQHYQRSQRLTYSEVEKYGVGYNKSWGWITSEDGTVSQRSLSRNTYFKPYFTLSHSYDSRNDGIGTRVVTSLYASFANGGGFYTESKGRRIASFIGEGGINEGHIDWAAVYDFNRAQPADEHGRSAQNIMSDYLAGHVQTGLKSSVIMDLSPRLNIDFGIHYQFYKTWENERITDLLGADYWYEDYTSSSLMGIAGRDPVKHVGDYIRTDNGRDQNYATIYGIATYRAGRDRRDIITLGTSLSGTLLRRWDRYNYDEAHCQSPWALGGGASVKAGVLHRATDGLSIYANAAAISRAPYASVFFASGNNEISRDIANEKNLMAEMGLRTVRSRWSLEATAYAAYWKDKSQTSPAYRSLDEDPVRYMVKGLDAFHYGLEVESSIKPIRWLTITPFVSAAQWKWMNDVSATIYDPYSMAPVEQINIYSKGLHVGDAPQFQIGSAIEARLPYGFVLDGEVTYNDLFWADFDPATRTDPQDRSEPFRLPSYCLVNLGASWRTQCRDFEISVFFNVNNVLNSFYIERGKDGPDHTEGTFTGYWACGRNYNFGVKLSLNRNHGHRHSSEIPGKTSSPKTDLTEL